MSIGTKKEEKSIYRYLLGQATEEERCKIEDRYFRDASYHEQVLALEEELICLYTRHELSPGLSTGLTEEERKSFETHFLASARRRKKYEMTRDLIAYSSENYAPRLDAGPRPSSWWKGLFGDSGFTSWRMAWAMAATILVTLCASAIFIVLKQQAPGRADSETNLQALQAQTSTGARTGDNQTTRQNPPNGPPVPDSEGGQSPAGLSAKSASHTAAPRKIRSFIPAFTVSLGARESDDPTEVNIPAAVSEIQLRIPTGESALTDYPRYEAAIKTLEGTVIWRRNNQKPRSTRTGPVIVLTIPAKFLEGTDYVLNLSGIPAPGESKFVHESFLSVKHLR